MFRVDFLKAQHGDAIWIEFGDSNAPRRVLIDGGLKGTSATLRKRLLALPEAERTIDLLIVSHVDRDHIEGVLELLDDPVLGFSARDVWFNGWRHLPGNELDEYGPVQGERLTHHLVATSLWNQAFGRGAAVVADDGPLPTYSIASAGGEPALKLTLLSPTIDTLDALRPVWDAEIAKHGLAPNVEPLAPEAPGDLDRFGPPDVASLANEVYERDGSEANGSSIGVLAEYEGARALLVGDAHSEVIEKAIVRLVGENGRLSVDVFKIPHHGSRKNIRKELLDRLDCRCYVVSTNGAYYKHPHDQAIARLIRHGGETPIIAFNYRTKHNEHWDDEGLKETWSYETMYAGEDDDALSLDFSRQP